MTDANANPGIPSGTRLMKQSEVTREMTDWAVQILHSMTPMFGTVEKVFGSVTIVARVEWHPPDFQNHTTHRGVTLYEVIAPKDVKHPTFVEGVDMSHFQGKADWHKVQTDPDNLSFIIIKATEGDTYYDAMFASNAANAKASGFSVGAYHFFRPKEDPHTQAKHFLDVAGAHLELPPVIDAEVMDGVSPKIVALGIKMFVEYLIQNRPSNEKPLVYTAPYFWNGIPSIGIEDLADLWIAEWGVAQPKMVGKWKKHKIWQYAATGRVQGVNGAIDVDRFNGTLDEFKAYVASSMSKDKPVTLPAPAPVPAVVGAGVTLPPLDEAFTTSPPPAISIAAPAPQEEESLPPLMELPKERIYPPGSRLTSVPSSTSVSLQQSSPKIEDAPGEMERESEPETQNPALSWGDDEGKVQREHPASFPYTEEPAKE